jgi:uncharacterized protein DUF4410
MIADSSAPVPPDAVIVTGEFIDIDEGNRLRRLVIGFGTGQSKRDTQIACSRPLAGRGAPYSNSPRTRTAGRCLALPSPWGPAPPHRGR